MKHRSGDGGASTIECRSRNFQRNRRRGMALLVVMVLVMFVSLAAYRYSFEMENEYRLTRLQEEQVQARLSAQSGIEYVASLLEQPLALRQSLLQSDVSQNSFRRAIEQKNLIERTLTETQEDSQWRFAILSQVEISDTEGVPGVPATVSQAGPTSNLGSLGAGAVSWKWGLESESSKLHIPTLLKWNQMRPGLARAVLLTLPEADEETVDGWLATLGVRTASTSAQDAMQTAMGGGMQSNLQRQQRTRSLERFKLRWLGGDLDQNYRLDAWEETLMERLLSDPLSGEPMQSPMARELSKVNSIAMGQGSGDGLEGQGPGAWNRYLTWVQGERNERPGGKRRIWLNQPDLRRLHRELSEIMSSSEADFVIAMRQYGPAQDRLLQGSTPGATPGGSSVAGASGGRSSVRRGVSGMSGPSGQQSANPGGAGSVPNGPWVPNWQVASKYVLKSPVELVGATLSIETAATGSSVSSSDPKAATAQRPSRQSLSSPWGGGTQDTKIRLAILLLETTTLDQPVIEGRIDIATASATVLSAVPGITPEIVQRVVQARQEGVSGGLGEGSDRQDKITSIGWLVDKGIVDWVKLAELEPYITTRSDVFSLQSVGFRDERSPVFRSTVLIDARQIPAQVRDLRVWHPWDRGFSTESLMQSVP